MVDANLLYPHAEKPALITSSLAFASSGVIDAPVGRKVRRAKKKSGDRSQNEEKSLRLETGMSSFCLLTPVS
jgi:hypothetical protein